MKILTNKELQKMLDDARAEGYNKSAEEHFHAREEEEYHRYVNESLKEIRTDMGKRLYEIEKRLGIRSANVVVGDVPVRQVGY